MPAKTSEKNEIKILRRRAVHLFNVHPPLPSPNHRYWSYISLSLCIQKMNALDDLSHCHKHDDAKVIYSVHSELLLSTSVL